MPANRSIDNLASAVRYALETTHAIAICPFHENVTVRVMTPRKRMPIFAPITLSKVTARHGSRKFFAKRLSVNFAMRQMVLALSVKRFGFVRRHERSAARK